MEHLIWHKASYSSGQGGNCVEIAETSTGTAIRDSKDPHGAVLRFTAAAWSAFTASIRAGEFG